MGADANAQSGKLDDELEELDTAQEEKPRSPNLKQQN